MVKWQGNPTHLFSIWLPEHQRNKIENNSYDGEFRNG